MKNYTLTFNEFLLERSSGEIFKPKKNRPIVFSPDKYHELAGEFYDLISTAYAEIGGHSKIESPSDVFGDPKWTYWEGIDIHGDNDFDIIMFGQKTKYGVKYSGVGHDGTSAAKRAYISERGSDLKKLGYYIEVSGKLANVLIKDYAVPIVTDQDTVEKVLGKPVTWIGNKTGEQGTGWYSRKIGNSTSAKILLGKPKL